jgi:hypothetical protein
MDPLQSKLHGRDADIAALATRNEGITILVGDPGVGKSAVLAASQQAAAGIAPDPIPVRYRPGAMQTALLESLAAAATLLGQRSPGLRPAELISNAANRLAQAEFSELARAVGKVLLSVLEQKIGAEAVAVIKDISGQVLAAREDLLVEKIRQGIDVDAIDMAVKFGGELQLQADGQDVILAFDNLERLDEADIRRLADLVQDLPRGMVIHGCLSRAMPADVRKLDELQRAGATIVVLEGLESEAVAAWLMEAEIPEARVGEVMRATHGYPLFIDAAIQYLRRGGELRDLPVDDQFRSIVRQAHFELDTDAQMAVAALAAFTDPVPSTRIPQLLGVAEARWHVLEAQFSRTRVFAVEIAGQPWFHQLRRRLIWTEVLSPAQRSEASTRAIRELSERTQSTGAAPSVCLQIAGLAPEAQGLSEQDDEFAYFAKCSRDEIALAAALIELAEPVRGSGAVDAQMMALHARSTFGVDGDLVSLMKRLADAQLMVLVEQGDAAAAVRTWKSWPATLLVVGRAAAECGRLPIQSAATATFELALRPHFGNFLLAQYGVGRATVIELMTAAPGEPASPFHRPRYGAIQPSMVVGASHGSLPLYAMATYVSDEARDQATLSEGPVDGITQEESIAISQVLRLPATAIPSRRFLMAAERLLGDSLGTTYDSSVTAPATTHLVSLDEEVETRVRVVAMVRDRCSNLERAAMRLVDSIGYVYGTHGDVSVLAEIRGWSGARRVENLPANSVGPYRWFEFARQLGISGNQSLGTITWRGGRGNGKDPAVETLAGLHKAASEFNRFQKPYPISVQERELRDAIREVATRVRDDLEALAGCVPYWRPTNKPHGRRTYLLLAPTPVTTAGLRMEPYEAHTLNVPTTEADDVNVRIVRQPIQPASSWESLLAIFMEHFGLSSAELGSGATISHTNAASAVARLLGFLESEIHLNSG